jgi:hypothetical protein
MATLNHFSYVLVAGAVLVMCALVLWQRGLGTRPWRVLILLGLAVILAGPPILFARQPTDVANAEALRERLRSGRPTLVEYYSPFCLGCVTTRPLSGYVESQFGDRVQVIYLDATDPVRGPLGREIGFTITPSYAIYDGRSTEPVMRLPGPVERDEILDQLRTLAGEPTP